MITSQAAKAMNSTSGNATLATSTSTSTDLNSTFDNTSMSLITNFIAYGADIPATSPSSMMESGLTFTDRDFLSWTVRLVVSPSVAAGKYPWALSVTDLQNNAVTVPYSIFIKAPVTWYSNITTVVFGQSGYSASLVRAIEADESNMGFDTSLSKYQVTKLWGRAFVNYYYYASGISPFAFTGAALNMVLFRSSYSGWSSFDVSYTSANGYVPLSAMRTVSMYYATAPTLAYGTTTYDNAIGSSYIPIIRYTSDAFALNASTIPLTVDPAAAGNTNVSYILSANVTAAARDGFVFQLRVANASAPTGNVTQVRNLTVGSLFTWNDVASGNLYAVPDAWPFAPANISLQFSDNVNPAVKLQLRIFGHNGMKCTGPQALTMTGSVAAQASLGDITPTLLGCTTTGPPVTGYGLSYTVIKSSTSANLAVLTWGYPYAYFYDSDLASGIVKLQFKGSQTVTQNLTLALSVSDYIVATTIYVNISILPDPTPPKASVTTTRAMTTTSSQTTTRSSSTTASSSKTSSGINSSTAPLSSTTTSSSLATTATSTTSASQSPSLTATSTELSSSSLAATSSISSASIAASKGTTFSTSVASSSSSTDSKISSPSTPIASSSSPTDIKLSSSSTPISPSPPTTSFVSSTVASTSETSTSETSTSSASAESLFSSLTTTGTSRIPGSSSLFTDSPLSDFEEASPSPTPATTESVDASEHSTPQSTSLSLRPASAPSTEDATSARQTSGITQAAVLSGTSSASPNPAQASTTASDNGSSSSTKLAGAGDDAAAKKTVTYIASAAGAGGIAVTSIIGYFLWKKGATTAATRAGQLAGAATPHAN
ncbi:uncharacterized protein EV422DRAFT_166225 [Fimicolochytrium jonesii]|uniref:uncharacterized protein n=1 Tax=Fimicolochytrium jonesii TaxID=1396493 RepID=UPI0022FE515B|nr:uncharacterized protein EV422DRAFT_166225 [Fimicolochytrium jonesii]KAI8818810.1 hypothetical protein EV422DRAFT_166225 [Fimicolochytrium jonesii]